MKNTTKKTDIKNITFDVATSANKRPASESKREKAKRLRIAGESYTNSKGQCVPGKSVGPDCKCRRSCYKKVDEKKRLDIFQKFYGLRSYDEQGSYLFGLIRKHDVKRKSKTLKSDGKFCTYKYHIRCKGRLIQVCKTAFANIHSISFKKIRNLCEKLDHDILYPHDLRGKHGNRPSKIPAEITDCIKNFILSVLQSDQLVEFIREDKTHHQYEINISQLYKQYMKVHEPKAFDVNGLFDSNYTRRVKTWFFKKVFDEEIVVDNIKLKQIMQVANNSKQSLGVSDKEQLTSSKESKKKSQASHKVKESKTRPLPVCLSEFEPNVVVLPPV